MICVENIINTAMSIFVVRFSQGAAWTYRCFLMHAASARGGTRKAHHFGKNGYLSTRG